jgi:hypothetical protein
LTLGQAAIRLSECGAAAERHVDWGLDDLRDSVRGGDYPIVGIERRYFGHPGAAHAVVVVAVRATEIEMLDPLLGPEPRVSLIETFAAAWRRAGSVDTGRAIEVSIRREVNSLVSCARRRPTHKLDSRRLR